MSNLINEENIVLILNALIILINAAIILNLLQKREPEIIRSTINKVSTNKSTIQKSKTERGDQNELCLKINENRKDHKNKSGGSNVSRNKNGCADQNIGSSGFISNERILEAGKKGTTNHNVRGQILITAGNHTESKRRRPSFVQPGTKKSGTAGIHIEGRRGVSADSNIGIRPGSSSNKKKVIKKGGAPDKDSEVEKNGAVEHKFGDSISNLAHINVGSRRSSSSSSDIQTIKSEAAPDNIGDEIGCSVDLKIGSGRCSLRNKNTVIKKMGIFNHHVGSKVSASSDEDTSSQASGSINREVNNLMETSAHSNTGSGQNISAGLETDFPSSRSTNTDIGSDRSIPFVSEFQRRKDQTADYSSGGGRVSTTEHSAENNQSITIRKSENNRDKTVDYSSDRGPILLPGQNTENSQSVSAPKAKIGRDKTVDYSSETGPILSSGKNSKNNQSISVDKSAEMDAVLSTEAKSISEQSTSAYQSNKTLDIGSIESEIESNKTNQDDVDQDMNAKKSNINIKDGNTIYQNRGSDHSRLVGESAGKFYNFQSDHSSESSENGEYREGDLTKSIYEKSRSNKSEHYSQSVEYSEYGQSKIPEETDKKVPNDKDVRNGERSSASAGDTEAQFNQEAAAEYKITSDLGDKKISSTSGTDQNIRRKDGNNIGTKSGSSRTNEYVEIRDIEEKESSTTGTNSRHENRVSPNSNMSGSITGSSGGHENSHVYKNNSSDLGSITKERHEKDIDKSAAPNTGSAIRSLEESNIESSNDSRRQKYSQSVEYSESGQSKIPEETDEKVQNDQVSINVGRFHVSSGDTETQFNEETAVVHKKTSDRDDKKASSTSETDQNIRRNDGNEIETRSGNSGTNKEVCSGNISESESSNGSDSSYQNRGNPNSNMSGSITESSAGRENSHIDKNNPSELRSIAKEIHEKYIGTSAIQNTESVVASSKVSNIESGDDLQSQRYSQSVEYSEDGQSKMPEETDKKVPNDEDVRNIERLRASSDDTKTQFNQETLVEHKIITDHRDNKVLSTNETDQNVRSQDGNKIETKGESSRISGDVEIRYIREKEPGTGSNDADQGSGNVSSNISRSIGEGIGTSENSHIDKSNSSERSSMANKIHQKELETAGVSNLESVVRSSAESNVGTEDAFKNQKYGQSVEYSDGEHGIDNQPGASREKASEVLHNIQISDNEDSHSNNNNRKSISGHSSQSEEKGGVHQNSSSHNDGDNLEGISTVSSSQSDDESGELISKESSKQSDNESDKSISKESSKQSDNESGGVESIPKDSSKQSDDRSVESISRVSNGHSDDKSVESISKEPSGQGAEIIQSEDSDSEPPGFFDLNFG